MELIEVGKAHEKACTQAVIHDLFASLEDSGSACELQQEADTDGSDAGDAQESAMEVVEPPRKLEFSAYWKAYLEATTKAEEDIKSVLQSGHNVFGRDYATGESFSSWQLVRSTRSAIISALVAKAEGDFAPPGGKLEIGTYDATSLLPDSWREAEDKDFDPDQLWVALEAKYGGDYGIELGRKQLGSEIVSAFCLGRNPPVRKSNRLELSDTIYTEKKYRGGVELAYTTAESVRKLHVAMAAFCEWAGDYATARKLEARAKDLWGNRDITSRERFDFGGIGYVTFNTSMTWEIYGELGDKFQAFISRYGREALERSRP